MGKEIIKFGNIKIGKRNFHHRKNLILLEDLDIDNMQVSSIVCSSKKIKIFYWHDDIKLNNYTQCFQKQALR